MLVAGPVVSLCFAPDQVELLCGTQTGNTYRLRSGSLQSLLVTRAPLQPPRALHLAGSCEARSLSFFVLGLLFSASFFA